MAKQPHKDKRLNAKSIVKAADKRQQSQAAKEAALKAYREAESTRLYERGYYNARTPR